MAAHALRRPATALLGVLALAATTAGPAAAQERPEEDARGDVPTRVRDGERAGSYVPLPWEHGGAIFPVLPRDETALVASEDRRTLTFMDGNELGGFLAAPEGGSAFFGSGLPIFGLGAPALLRTGVLRPLGDGGDTFLGRRPSLSLDSAIPKVGETLDKSREAFAFIDGVPPLPEDAAGPLQFPLAGVVESDTSPGCRDNDAVCIAASRPTRPPTNTPPVVATPSQPGAPIAPGPTPTTPTTPSTPSTVGPTTPTTPRRPLTTAPAASPVPTTAPVATAPPGGTTTTTTRPTTTTTRPPVTTTTTRPTATTTTTTVRPTTTTTRPTTTTTTTTTTTAPAPEPPPFTPPNAAFVLSNQVIEGGVRANTGDLCLSSTAPSNANPSCDRLFDFGGGDGDDGFMRLGQEYFVNLTLWNIPPSNVDAVALRGFAKAPCTSTPTAASSSSSLCRAIMVKIQRYSDPLRTQPSQCVYGGGDGTTCTWDDARTLWSFGQQHSSMATGAPIGNGLQVDAKAYLRISVKIADSGLDARGIGADNHLIGQQANLAFRWQMDSA